MNQKRKGGGSYVEVYFYCCNKESKTDDKIDIQVFKQLAKLDTKLGITASEQLLSCLSHTIRSDIIQVRFYDVNISLKNYFRLSILNKSMNMKGFKMLVIPDLPIFTWRVVIKYQKQVIKLMKKSTLD